MGAAFPFQYSELSSSTLQLSVLSVVEIDLARPLYWSKVTATAIDIAVRFAVLVDFAMPANVIYGKSVALDRLSSQRS